MKQDLTNVNLEDKVSYNYSQKLFEDYNKFPEYINEPLIKATIKVESSFNPFAKSNVGASGYPQTYYSTWKDVFPHESYNDFKKGIKNMKKSEEFVAKYYNILDNFLRKNMKGYKSLPKNEKQVYLAAAYNYGPGNLQKADFNLEKTPMETRNYVKKIRNAYERII
jgi:soluble lytic murein transglycosylase-like protein